MVVLVDYKNLIGRSKVMKSVSIIDGVEFDSSMRDACLSIISSPRSKMVIFCLDGFPKFRYDLLPAYKEGRTHAADVLPRYPVQRLLQDMQDVGRQFHTKVALAMSPFMEADDVIASISRGVNENTSQDIYADDSLVWWANLGAWRKLCIDASKFCIMSSDSDLLQLLTGDPLRKVMRVEKMSLIDATLDLPVSWAKKGVLTPGELLSYKVLEGDSGDKIPRSRTAKPSILKDKFWKTLNTPDKLSVFLHEPALFPELEGAVDISKVINNIKLIALYPQVTPYFLELC